MTDPVDFFVNDTSPMANPVQGVTVKILSPDGKTFVTQGTTDASGHAGFLLPDGNYQARFFKFQTGFQNPQLFSVVAGQNEFNVAATVLDPPVPTDPRLCTAFGYFRDITGAPQAYVEIHFIAKFDPVWLDGAGVLKERVIIRTDEKGYAEVNLIRNGQYDCTIQGEEDVTRTISVPDAPNVNLPDLIFPVISLIEWTNPPPFTVGIGQQISSQATVYGSDGENLGSGCGQILFKNSDDTVAVFSYSPTGLLTVTGLKSGTTTITISRADQSIVRIPDNGIENGTLVITVP